MSRTLPIVAMRGAVMFPGASVPIVAARAATVRAIEAAMRDPEHRVFAVAQRDTGVELSPDRL
jgi:ATP-dependent Lon protease